MIKFKRHKTYKLYISFIIISILNIAIRVYADNWKFHSLNILGTHQFINSTRQRLLEVTDLLLYCSKSNDCVLCLDYYDDLRRLSVKRDCTKSHTSPYSQFSVTNDKNKCILAKWNEEHGKHIISKDNTFDIFRLCHNDKPIATILIGSLKIQARHYSTGHRDLLLSGILPEGVKATLHFNDKVQPTDKPIWFYKNDSGVYGIIRFDLQHQVFNTVKLTLHAYKEIVIHTFVLYNIFNRHKRDRALWDYEDKYLLQITLPSDIKKIYLIVIPERGPDNLLSYCGNAYNMWKSDITSHEAGSDANVNVELTHPGHSGPALICACVKEPCTDPSDFNILVQVVDISGDKFTYYNVDPFGQVSIYQDGYPISSSILLLPSSASSCSEASKYIKLFDNDQKPIYYLPKQSSSTPSAPNENVTKIFFDESQSLAPINATGEGVHPPFAYKFDPTFNTYDSNALYIDKYANLTFQPDYAFYSASSRSLYQSIMVPNFYFGSTTPFRVCGCANESLTGCGAPSDFTRDLGFVHPSPIRGNSVKIDLRSDNKAVFSIDVAKDYYKRAGFFRVVHQDETIGRIVKATPNLPEHSDTCQMISDSVSLLPGSKYDLFFLLYINKNANRWEHLKSFNVHGITRGQLVLGRQSKTLHFQLSAINPASGSSSVRLLKGKSHKCSADVESIVTTLFKSEPKYSVFSLPSPLKKGLYTICPAYGSEDHLGYLNISDHAAINVDHPLSSGTIGCIGPDFIVLTSNSNIARYKITDGYVDYSSIHQYQSNLSEIISIFCHKNYLIVASPHSLLQFDNEMKLIYKLNLKGTLTSASSCGEFICAVNSSQITLFSVEPNRIKHNSFKCIAQKHDYKDLIGFYQGKNLHLLFTTNNGTVHCGPACNFTSKQCQELNICEYTKIHYIYTRLGHLVCFFKPLLKHARLFLLKNDELILLKLLLFEEPIIDLKVSEDLYYLGVSQSGSKLTYGVVALNSLRDITLTYPTWKLHLILDNNYEFTPKFNSKLVTGFEWLNKHKYTNSGFHFNPDTGIIYANPVQVGKIHMLIRAFGLLGFKDFQVDFFIKCGADFTIEEADGRYRCGVCEAGFYYDDKTHRCLSCHDYLPYSTTEARHAYNNSFCLCMPGYYFKDDVCLPCPAGTFKDVIGNVSCYGQCPLNMVSSVRGASDLQSLNCECKPGFYHYENECIECETGNYCPGLGFSRIRCPEYTNTKGTGATSISECLCIGGYYMKDGKCRPCSRFDYKESLSNSPCTSCTSLVVSESRSENKPNHISDDDEVLNRIGLLFSLETGSTSLENCRYCSFGFYVGNDFKCKLCKQDWYCRMAMIPCGPNMVTKGLGASSPMDCGCPPGWGVQSGSHNLLTGLPRCEICRIGTFQNVYGSLSPCLPCPAGTTTKTKGAVSITECVSLEGNFMALPIDYNKIISAEKNLKTSKVEYGLSISSHGEYAFRIYTSTLKKCVSECLHNVYCRGGTFSKIAFNPSFRNKGFINGIITDVEYFPCTLEYFGYFDIQASYYNDNVPDDVILGHSISFKTNSSSTFLPVARCIKDHYCPFNSSPIHCPSHSTTLSTGSTLVSDCKCLPGYQPLESSPYHQCVPCPIGFYKDSTSNGRCVQCGKDMTTANTASKGIDQCVCNPTMYAKVIRGGRVTCAHCPPSFYCLGYWMESVFQKIHTFPQPCSKNSQIPSGITNRASPTICVCDPGYSVSGTIHGIVTCTECPRGTFKEELGNSSCTSTCKSHSTSYPGSKNANDCFCKYGSFAPNNRPNECIPCLEGAICPGGFNSRINGVSSNIVPRYGHFFIYSEENSNKPWTPYSDYKTVLTEGDTDYVTTPIVHSCPLPTRCPGLFSPNCALGSRGYLCSLCDDGYDYNYFKGNCTSCKKFVVEILLLIVPRMINALMAIGMIRGVDKHETFSIICKMWYTFTISTIPFGNLQATTHSSLGRYLGAYSTIFYLPIALFGLNSRLSCLGFGPSNPIARLFPKHDYGVVVWYLQKMYNMFIAPVLDFALLFCMVPRWASRFIVILAYMHTPSILLNAFQMLQCVRLDYPSQEKIKLLYNLPTVVCNPRDPLFILGRTIGSIFIVISVLYWLRVLSLLRGGKGFVSRFHSPPFPPYWDIFLQVRIGVLIFFLTRADKLNPAGEVEHFFTLVNLVITLTHLIVHMFKNQLITRRLGQINALESCLLVSNVFIALLFYGSFYFNLEFLGTLPIIMFIYSSSRFIMNVYFEYEIRNRFRSLLIIPGKVYSASWYWFTSSCFSYFTENADVAVYFDYSVDSILLEPGYWSSSEEFRDEISRYHAGAKPNMRLFFNKHHLAALNSIIVDIALLSVPQSNRIFLTFSSHMFLVRFSYWFNFVSRITEKDKVIPEAAASFKILANLFSDNDKEKRIEPGSIKNSSPTLYRLIKVFRGDMSRQFPWLTGWNPKQFARVTECQLQLIKLLFSPVIYDWGPMSLFQIDDAIAILQTLGSTRIRLLFRLYQFHKYATDNEKLWSLLFENSSLTNDISILKKDVLESEKFMDPATIVSTLEDESKYDEFNREVGFWERNIKHLNNLFNKIKHVSAIAKSLSSKKDVLVKSNLTDEELMDEIHKCNKKSNITLPSNYDDWERDDIN